MSLVATWIPRDVEVRVLTAGSGPGGRYVHLGIFSVRPARAREGISLMECYELAAVGDEDAWSVVRRVLCGWLPLRLSSQLVATRFKRANAIRVAISLLSVGVPDAKRHDEDRRLVEQKAERQGWSRIVREYRHLTGGTLDEPWAYFLSQAAGLDELRARAELSFMRAYSSARSSKAAPRNHIIQRAGFGAAWEEMSREEKEQRGQEGLEKLAEIYRQQQANPMA